MKFLDHLVEEGILPRAVFEDALHRHGRKEARILEELSGNAVLDGDTVLERMSVYYKLPKVDLLSAEKDPEAMRLIPYELASRYGVFPLKLSENALTVAVSDPSDFFTRDDLRAVSGRRIERVLSAAEDIRNAIEKYYRLDEGLRNAVNGLADPDIVRLDRLAIFAGLEECQSPVSKTVQRILENAVQLKASDIHFEPQEKCVELRYRIHGDLSTIQSLPSQSCAALVARIKVLCQMDIAEQRKPQDGRARLTFRGQKVDLRVSTLPTFFGEKVVIRLLNQESLAVESLDALGLDPSQREAYLKAITSKQGIVLVTGPTGSGKTTTLYASLNHIKSGKHNITTIEDPIEYLLTGINQSQIHSRIGVTFASMLRSILRQDPDVILVGEIRDRETADIAFRSSLTGHLVFSTLHTNGAVGAVTRLYDLGLEPYLVGSALLCVVAQRLVRVICEDCRYACQPDAEVLEQLKEYLPQGARQTFYRGRGCPKCSQTGFRGRTAVFEVLPVTDEIRSGISTRLSESALYTKVKRLGFKTLAEAAVEKALEGLTPLEEALPFLPTYESPENDLFMQLADFIDSHQPQRLVVVKNEELIRKILANASPPDYALIEPAPEPVTPPTFPLLLTRAPEAAEDAASSERRRNPRIARDFLLKFHPADGSSASDWETAVVKNLSVDGCYFRAERPLPEGRQIQVQLQLPISRETLPAKAVVRHCRSLAGGEGFHLLGVSFESVAPKGQSDLRRVVSFFLNKAARPKETAPRGR